MTILNEKFYENLDKKIDSISSKEEAETFIKQVFEPIQEQLDSLISKVSSPALDNLTAYINIANAIVDVQTPPTDLGELVTWASNIIKVYGQQIALMKKQIQPYLSQYEAASTMLSGLPSEITQLQNHFNTKIQEKGWTITIPSITIPILPNLPTIPNILKN